MESTPPLSRRTDRALAATTSMLLAYWGCFALTAPVTVWDSQTYNLGRLLIAQRGGLFGNPNWTNEWQVMYPWSFDAVHLPFLPLHWGYALPSFLSLLGIAWILFQVLTFMASRRVAWLGVLALLSLPTVIFQATSTKNDLGLVFVTLFAAYSLFRFTLEPSARGWLWLSACAVGFLPGIKSSGLPLAALLGVWTVISLRRQPRLVLAWIGLCSVALLLLGSSEIALNNVITYHHPLGPERAVQFHSNRDGFGGTTANFIRYVFGLLNPGLLPIDPDPAWAATLETACRNTLALLGLSDRGVDGAFSDRTLRFYKMGWESASDFGFVGSLAMIFAAGRLAWLKRRDAAWWFAAGGWVTILLTAATIAWMPWNNRFLMLPMISFVTSALLFFRRPLTEEPKAALLAAMLLLYGCIAYPMYSFNKRPSDLIAAVTRRETAMLKERSSMTEIVESIRRHHRETPGATWLLHAGANSWVFCLLDQSEPTFQIVPSPALERLSSRIQSELPHPVYLLVLNRAWTPPGGAELVQKFRGETDSALYRWNAPAN